MDERDENSNRKTFEMLSEESGLAIAVVDNHPREVYVSNNNSICRTLNPDGKFSPDCAEYCGKALEMTAQSGGTVAFECHAGLECRAVPVKNPNTPLVAIVGRTFVRSDNYRRATQRSMKGDWRKLAPAELFDNVLMSASPATLDRTARQVEELIANARSQKKAITVKTDAPIRTTPKEISNVVERFNREIRRDTPPTGEPEQIRVEQVVEAIPEAPPAPVVAAPVAERRSPQTQAWRSFFGSLLKSDYSTACETILDFVGDRFALKSLVWLDRHDNRLENTVAIGDMKNRKIRLGIAADDHRLIEAAESEMPLSLGERSGTTKGVRTMNLFPIGVGDEISAAIAVLDTLDFAVKTQIVKVCRSLAPQIEILRLRFEVKEGEALTLAVKRFGQNLKKIDSDDFWLRLLQSSAEMMRSERASLLIHNDRSEKLDVKAVVGVKEWTKNNGEIGGRVARLVFDKNKAVAVADVTKTGLPPANPERQYKTKSFMSCPISIGDRAIGVMNFTDKPGGETFNRSSIDLFQAIAPQLAVAIDRASFKHKAGELAQISVTDSLTGLLNRRYIEARLAEEIKRSNRHGFPMSFMMLDVDNFKSYNDEFGHPAGDEALKLVGAVIRDTLRGADVAARFGGEEFSILLPQTTAEEALAIGERIRHNIEHANFQHRLVTVSIGVASCSAELCVSADLVSAADQALYESKRRGRNRVLSFEEIGGRRNV